MAKIHRVMLEYSFGIDAYLKMYRFFYGVIILNNCQSLAHTGECGLL